MPTADVFHAYAAFSAKGELKPFEYRPGPLGDEQVEITVTSCGLCHSDLSMLDNDWGMSAYPFVPGHEVVGTVAAAGKNVKRVKEGDTVGLGWYSASCMSCRQCMSGNHNLCPTAEGTMIGRHGGFSDRVRCHWAWATPLPAGVNAATAGPLFCGGITVFNPFVQFDVRPTDHVGVVGIGGLGHMGIKFARAWGCAVTAFTSSPDKAAEARELGAHQVINSRNAEELAKAAGTFDFILSTVNVPLEWAAYFNALAPKGRLHMVGAVTEPVPMAVFPMIVGQKAFSASPLGAPTTTQTMLDFCARHGIQPVTEQFPMSKVNDALARLRSGKARYRVVLTKG